MTITSTRSGTQNGYTVITVSPAKTLSANKYRYKLSASDITLPSIDTDLSTWTLWNGTDEISATNGYCIAVAECDAYNRCDKVGKTTVVSRVTSTITYYCLDSAFTGLAPTEYVEVPGLTPTSYVEGVGATLPTADEAGLIINGFDFWVSSVEDIDDSTKAVTAIGASETGNKSFYAHFTQPTEDIPDGE